MQAGLEHLVHLQDLPEARIGVSRGAGEQLSRAWVGVVPGILLQKVGLKWSHQVFGVLPGPLHQLYSESK